MDLSATIPMLYIVSHYLDFYGWHKTAKVRVRSICWTKSLLLQLEIFHGQTEALCFVRLDIVSMPSSVCQPQECRWTVSEHRSCTVENLLRTFRSVRSEGESFRATTMVGPLLRLCSVLIRSLCSLPKPDGHTTSQTHRVFFAL